MEKEFEALEKIGAEKLARGELIRNDDKLEPYVAILKSALTELKAIKEAKPSEAMRKLEHVINSTNLEWMPECIREHTKGELGIVKQSLLKAQEQEKAWEIVKEKNVNIGLLKGTIIMVNRGDTDWKYYNRMVVEDRHNSKYELTQEEFELLKRWSDK